jgi:hypothetical protein
MASCIKGNCEICATDCSALRPSGNYSHREGHLTLSKGEASHAEGKGTCDIEMLLDSLVEGKQDISGRTGAVFNSACGDASHVEGCGTVATGDHSHAEGAGTQATGHASHAEGVGTKASGVAAHAEGDPTLAEGDFSHAEGTETYAKGEASHSEGKCTCAIADYSHASGIDAVARLYAQRAWASGKFECKGDAQCSTYMLRNRVDTGPGNCDKLYLDGDLLEITIPCNSLWHITICVVAKSLSGDAPFKSWKLDTMIEVHNDGTFTISNEDFVVDQCHPTDPTDHLDMPGIEFDEDECTLHIYGCNDEDMYPSDIDPEPYLYVATVTTIEVMSPYGDKCKNKFTKCKTCF